MHDGEGDRILSEELIVYYRFAFFCMCVCSAMTVSISIFQLQQSPPLLLEQTRQGDLHKKFSPLPVPKRFP